ncbi:DUF3426 domain-containing protein [Marinimicrobium agarilyticum]|uniref:DUF3426 domain-containing protein n=1 Tax=Marinimicrobium agarilyticum TaxID=306546 RepID=UPI0003FEE5DE|nr:DUF3426 domain-containing protein [Marinimicrobium agarilyticum]
MAPTKMVTRCPQCGTSFRITPAQLQSARGAVRCGACLHIFKARDHLVGDQALASESALVRKPNQPASQQPAKPGRAPKAPQKTAGSATRSPRDTSPGKGAPSKTPGKPAPSAKTSSGKSALRFDQSLIDEESTQMDDDDFLISDDMGEPGASQVEDPFGIGKQVKSSHSLFDRRPKKEEEEHNDETDESWAMSLLEEEEERSADINVTPREDEPENDASTFEMMEQPETPPTREEEEEAQIRFHLEGADDEDDYQPERLSARDPERSALLMNIDPEPVEMDWVRKNNRENRRRWLWPGLAALAIVLLVLQVAWLQFDRLSRLEPYRSVYGAICPLVGCELPTLIDRSQIRAYNLVVRNHPEREGALIVDAILLNTAPFDQPFPDLVLEFSELGGDTVAARQFSPDEYLSGELAGREIMPANQPVHLTLELVDPGEEAVNYRAYIPE